MYCEKCIVHEPYSSLNILAHVCESNLLPLITTWPLVLTLMLSILLTTWAEHGIHEALV